VELRYDGALDALEAARVLGRHRTMGGFIDHTMELLHVALGDGLVSFNELNLTAGTATVSLRPYREHHRAAVADLKEILAEHPMFQWYSTHPDWSAVRLSDLVEDQDAFRATRLFREVLEPVGGQHAICISVTPPSDAEWMYFMVNRAEHDFTDAELHFTQALQGALVALEANLSEQDRVADRTPPHITQRELTVLRCLAAGHTAARISHELAISPGTVRKHLENLYRKLGTTDRLGAVIQGRDFGLLREDEVSREFTWNVWA
jgi:DNA-binding CsgD family transcriptional regulator